MGEVTKKLGSRKAKKDISPETPEEPKKEKKAKAEKPTSEKKPKEEKKEKKLEGEKKEKSRLKPEEKEKAEKKRKTKPEEKKARAKPEEKENKEGPAPTDVSPKARPLCSEKIAGTLYDAISVASNNSVLKIGANEVIKSLNKGTADMVILAGNTKPFAIIEPLMGLCEDKNRSYYFVKSTSALGKACGLSRPVAACSILYTEQASLKKLLNEIRDKMQN